MKTKLLYFVVVFSISIFNTVYCQEGIVDPTFNTYDDGLLGDGFDSTVRTVSLQSDGNLIVGGDFLNFNGAVTPKLCRLLPDGSKDPSFILGTGFTGNVYCTLLQPDGKIIVGGAFTSFNGSAANRLIRLNPNGSRDASFDTSIAASSGIIHSIALQVDGNLIIVGSFANYNGISAPKIARILPNGNLDATFAIGSGANSLVEEVHIQQDGKIILGGSFVSFNGTTCGRIIRLNSNGTVDASFVQGAGFDANISALTTQTDGKIIIGGDFLMYNGIVVNRIIRLNLDGSRDASFNSGIGLSNGVVEVVKVNSTGSIMLGGSFSGTYNGTNVNRLLLLDSNGVLDPIFDIGAGPGSASILNLAPEPDGSWYVGGSFSVFDSQNQGRLAKVDATGVLDIGYLTAGVGFDNSVLKVVSLSNTKTLVVGNFNKFNGVSAPKIALLLDNGAIDNSFNVAASGADGLIKNAIVQSDHKIVIGGNFLKYNGVTVNRITRILPDGSIDVSFNTGLGFNSQIYGLALQADGKIIVGGNFTKFNGMSVNRIVRLLSDGTLDTSFNVGLGADEIIETVLVLPDGKIVVGGRFSTFNGIAHNRLVRLDFNGSVDSGFVTGLGFDKNVYCVEMQSDTKLIVGGSFLNYKGSAAKRIIRLNSDGSLDTSFAVGSGFSNGDVRAVLIQPDGRVLIGGAFSGTYNGTAVKRLIRVLPTGIFDISFSANLNSPLYSISLTPNHKVMIGGNFNSVSGVTKHRAARLLLCLDTTIWNGVAWGNGAPSSEKRIIFNGNYPVLNSVNACSCSINSGYSVGVPSGNTLGLVFNYSGLGTLILENNASLYQTNDASVNTGIINIKRQTTPIIMTDYSYWSSPVSNQKLVDVSPNTLLDKFFSFDATTDSWFEELPTNSMDLGKGYIIRGPQYFSTTIPAPYEAVFTGVPNNGKIAIPIGGNNTSNLIGNPYPSAISADMFLTKNKDYIDGTIYFWTHNTPITNNVYTSNDYAVYNLLGGVGVQATNSGVNNSIPNGKIASGQSFFTTSISNGGTVIFNNSMRQIVGMPIDNSQFFRTKNNNYKVATTTEKHRIWLNLSNAQGAFKQLLVGYASGATNEYDGPFDGETFDGNEFVDFYSVSQDRNLVIQGRALPFDAMDVIPLGFRTTIAGTFTVSIDQFDGFFLNQSVFLEDKLNHVIFDLKKANYTFDTAIGTFQDRFVLRYTDKALATEDIDPLSNQLIIVKDKNELKIKSELKTIKRITVYDLLGRKVFEKDTQDSNEFRSSSIALSKQIAIVKVTLSTDKVISKKVQF